MPRLPTVGLPAALLLLTPLLAGCGGDPTDPGPAVHRVQVSPSAVYLDLSDTVRLSASLTDRDGETLTDPGLTWRVVSGGVTVDGAGLVTGVTPGLARVEAVASNGATGAADVRVTPLAALQPDTGRWGQPVRLEGSGFPDGMRVFFRAQAGGRVEAQVERATAEALDVWVPVGAVSGTLRLAWPGDTVATSSAFHVTAAADIYAGLDAPASLPFPFLNPSLLATSDAPHAFRFSIPAATPFSLRLIDGGAPPGAGASAGPGAVRAWLFRTAPAPTTLVSFVMTWADPSAGAALDSVAYGRAALAAGEYALVVSALDPLSPSRPGVRRAFGLRLSDAPSFDRAPDDREPNDIPGESAAVTLPFTGTGLGAENPYAMDHYAFEVDEPSDITVTARTAAPWLLLYLVADGALDILDAWAGDRVVAETDGAAEEQTLQATVGPGRYTLLVWEWGGHARPYELEIAAGPAAATDGWVAADGRRTPASRTGPRAERVRRLVEPPTVPRLRDGGW